MVNYEEAFIATMVARGFAIVMTDYEAEAGQVQANAPVLINSNRYDPLVPWTAANQLGRDWCDKGADVEFRTNEEPPFLNKLVINHALPMLVDGEPAMQWIAAGFSGEPTSPNCGTY